MEFLIACLAASGAFGIFFAVFFIKRRAHGEPAKVHTCAQQKCNCENDGGKVQILDNIEARETQSTQPIQ